MKTVNSVLTKIESQVGQKSIYQRFE